MNGYNFSARTRIVLAMAREEAGRLHHEYVGTEHILLGLLAEGDGVGVRIVRKLGVDAEALPGWIEAEVKMGKSESTSGPDLPYTSRAKKVLELAMTEARQLHHSYVGTEHLLLGMIGEEKGIAAHILSECGVTIEAARRELVCLLGEDAGTPSVSSVSLDRHMATPQLGARAPARAAGRTRFRYTELGCRIPKDYFWTIGWGESDVGIETGSYDAALTMAGIENFNIMLYTSVLPPEATEISHLPDIHHGSVLEGIIAIQHTDQPGRRITAGVLLAKVFRKSDESFLGGFACEYAGNDDVQYAEANLQEAMRQLFARRYSSDLYRLEVGKIVVRTFVPSKAFGTVLVGIGFSSYLSPVLNPSVTVAASHKDKSHVKYTTS
jgi:pyruvoyl-dependent arginine decarboxylase